MKINFERIKYSPFGKQLMKRFKTSFIIGALIFPLMLLHCLIFFAGKWWIGIISIPITVAIPLLIMWSSTKEALFQARLLSDLTDEEHNKLVAEYKKYEERNITRYGHLTSYGLVLDAHILPWENIKQIEFIPGEYRWVYTNRGGYEKYYPAKIKVTSIFGTKRITTTSSLSPEEYDLTDELGRFLESIPQYTDKEIKVENNYYYAKR